MRAVRISDFGQRPVISEVPDPVPGPRDAVVRITAAGVCRSDWHIWKGDWVWVGVNVALPITSGHEAGGIVESLGDEVGSLRVGQRVTMPFHEACGVCPTCRSGATNLCPDASYPGSSKDGSHAELVLVANADLNCIPIPDAVSDVAAAAMGCRYMTAFHAADVGALNEGDWCAIFGCGGLGLSLVQIAVARGARVLAIDRDPDKLHAARAEGAEETFDTRAELWRDIQAATGGVQVTFDAVGSADTFGQAIRSLRRRGRHVQVGLTSRSARGIVPLPADLVTFREIAVLGSIGCPHNRYPAMIEQVADGRLVPDRLVGAQVSMTDVPDVLEAMDSYATSGLVIARPGG